LCESNTPEALEQLRQLALRETVLGRGISGRTVLPSSFIEQLNKQQLCNYFAILGISIVQEPVTVEPLHDVEDYADVLIYAISSGAYDNYIRLHLLNNDFSVNTFLAENAIPQKALNRPSHLKSKMTWQQQLHSMTPLHDTLDHTMYTITRY
jgi:hypothetical protein